MSPNVREKIKKVCVINNTLFRLYIKMISCNFPLKLTIKGGCYDSDNFCLSGSHPFVYLLYVICIFII